MSLFLGYFACLSCSTKFLLQPALLQSSLQAAPTWWQAISSLHLLALRFHQPTLQCHSLKPPVHLLQHIGNQPSWHMLATCAEAVCFLQLKDDEELGGALDSLDVSLKENIQMLSSFEKYKKEVLGDSLDWTPMHTSAQVCLPVSCVCLCPMSGYWLYRLCCQLPCTPLLHSSAHVAFGHIMIKSLGLILVYLCQATSLGESNAVDLMRQTQLQQTCFIASSVNMPLSTL